MVHCVYTFLGALTP